MRQAILSIPLFLVACFCFAPVFLKAADNPLITTESRDRARFIVMAKELGQAGKHREMLKLLNAYQVDLRTFDEFQYVLDNEDRLSFAVYQEQLRLALLNLGLNQPEALFNLRPHWAFRALSQAPDAMAPSNREFTRAAVIAGIGTTEEHWVSQIVEKNSAAFSTDPRFQRLLANLAEGDSKDVGGLWHILFWAPDLKVPAEEILNTIRSRMDKAVPEIRFKYLAVLEQVAARNPIPEGDLEKMLSLLKTTDSYAQAESAMKVLTSASKFRPASPEGIQAMGRWVNGESEHAADEAIDCLADVSTRQKLPIDILQEIVGAVFSPRFRNGDVRKAGIAALEKIAQRQPIPTQAQDRISAHLREGRKNDRIVAIKILEGIGKSRTIPVQAIAELLKDPDDDIRASVMRSLGSLAATHPIPSSAISSIVEQLLLLTPQKGSFIELESLGGIGTHHELPPKAWEAIEKNFSIPARAPYAAQAMAKIAAARPVASSLFDAMMKELIVEKQSGRQSTSEYASGLLCKTETGKRAMQDWLVRHGHESTFLDAVPPKPSDKDCYFENLTQTTLIRKDR